MISRILVPTDGSETGTKAVHYAIQLAKQTGSSITLLHVIDKSSIITKSIPAVATPTHVMEPIDNYLRAAAESYISEAEKTCRRKRVKPSSVIRSGHPVEEIIKEARKIRASLIVMGSHGGSALRSAVLGSVTFGVIHKDTKFPVLVTRK